MYKYILVFILFIGSFSVIGQGDQYIRINEAFGENYAEELAETNPSKLSMLAKYAKTGFILLKGNVKSKNIIEINEVSFRSKKKSLTIDEFLDYIQNKNYNPLLFDWMPSSQPKIYQLGASGYFVCLPSKDQLNRI